MGIGDFSMCKIIRNDQTNPLRFENLLYVNMGHIRGCKSDLNNNGADPGPHI